MRQIDTLCSLLNQTDVLLVDMFGTIWTGSDFYADVIPVLSRFKEAGKRVYILSNATDRSAVLIGRVTAKGLIQGAHFDDFISSGEVFFHLIQGGFWERLTHKPDYRFYVLGRPNILLFQTCAGHQTTDITQADAVYISGLETTGGLPTTLDPFIPVVQQALSLGIPAVCANPDYIALNDNRVYLTGGSLARWYADAGGCVHWIGKPYPDVFQFVFDRLQAKPNQCVMVGDTLRTDIKGGYDAGTQTVLITDIGVTDYFVKQGKSMVDQMHAAGVQPDYLIPSFR